MARLTRLLLAAVLTTFAFTGLGIGATSASATALPISQCTTTSGVILAVDFSHWGGPLLRSCGSVPTTGYTLLNQGGWQTQGTNHDGPAFICRIGYSGFQGGTKYPTSATEACNLTPPASAYWSYWHANPGKNTWSYSQLGAMSYKPVNGSVDLWIFGGTNVAGTTGTPQITPDSIRAHNVSVSGGGAAPSTHGSSAPTAEKPATSVPPVESGSKTTGAGSDSGMNRGPAASSSAAKSSRTPPTTSACATPTPTASKSASPSNSDTPTPTPSPCSSTSTTATARSGSLTSGRASSVPSSGTKIIDAEPVANIKHSSGSFVPELIAGVVVLALGGAAGVTGWRRRQAR